MNSGQGFLTFLDISEGMEYLHANTLRRVQPPSAHVGNVISRATTRSIPPLSLLLLGMLISIPLLENPAPTMLARI